MPYGGGYGYPVRITLLPFGYIATSDVRRRMVRKIRWARRGSLTSISSLSSCLEYLSIYLKVDAILSVHTNLLFFFFFLNKHVLSMISCRRLSPFNREFPTLTHISRKEMIFSVVFFILIIINIDSALAYYPNWNHRLHGGLLGVGLGRSKLKFIWI